MDHGQPGSKGPTTYADLNNVLHDLLVEVTKILDRNLCGAYLQGSFAVGDSDVHSDVDFLVVTYDEVNATQELELRAMHERFPARDVDWAKHLEGSYVPGQSLRRIDPAQPAWLYVDNGSKVMERSAHDNTAVVRWSMREHGIVLSGPDPRDLIDPVTATDLRSEIFARIDAFMPDLLIWWTTRGPSHMSWDPCAGCSIRWRSAGSRPRGRRCCGPRKHWMSSGLT
jgi:predicted nucleotidyltransferase